MIFNSVQFSGRFTVDPEIKELSKETDSRAVNFSLAQNIKVKGVDDAIFLNCVAYGKVADNVVACKQGDEVLVEGRLNQNRWLDSEGGKREKFEVIVSRIHYVRRKSETKVEPSK